MQSRSYIALAVFVSTLGLAFPACAPPDSDEDAIGSVQQAELILPCGACSYGVSSKYLDGTMNSRSEQAWPLTGMTLELYDSGGSVLATITGLTPSSCYGGSSIDQTVSTSVTSGVASAKLFWTDAGGAQVNQTISVTH